MHFPNPHWKSKLRSSENDDIWQEKMQFSASASVMWCKLILQTCVNREQRRLFPTMTFHTCSLKPKVRRLSQDPLLLSSKICAEKSGKFRVDAINNDLTTAIWRMDWQLLLLTDSPWFRLKLNIFPRSKHLFNSNIHIFSWKRQLHLLLQTQSAACRTFIASNGNNVKETFGWKRH